MKIFRKILAIMAVVAIAIYIFSIENNNNNKGQKKQRRNKSYGPPMYAKKEITKINGGIRLKTNCRGIDVVGILPAGKDVVKIKHRRSHLTKENRCSQAIDKPIKVSGKKIKDEWINELTLPTKPQGNSFVLRDLKTGRVVAWTGIKEGGIAKLKRPKNCKGPLQIEHFANIVASITSIQIGYDGSSATFEFYW